MLGSSTNFSGQLSAQPIRPSRPHKARSIRIPRLGRVILSRDPGEASIVSREVFATNLSAHHRDGDGAIRHAYDLGSGTVTNVGVMALANDFNWATGARFFKLLNFHATGTGVTAAAATDLTLQTAASPTATTAVTGTQSFLTNPNAQTFKAVATINYTSTLAITEWGLFTASALSATTGSPATAVNTTSLTATGTPFTASSGSVQGQQVNIVKTGTTASYMLVCANTTSKLSGAGDGGASNTANDGSTSWYKVSDGTDGTTPGNTETYALLPVMFDHKVFSPINVNSGDSIQFTYSLLLQSGG